MTRRELELVVDAALYPEQAYTCPDCSHPGCIQRRADRRELEAAARQVMAAAHFREQQGRRWRVALCWGLLAAALTATVVELVTRTGGPRTTISTSTRK